MAPHNVYPCRGEDKWIAITAGSDVEWAALSREVGQAGLISDPRFATAVARKQNEDAIDAIMTGWTRDMDHIEAMHRLQAAGVPAAAVMTTEELANDPQFLHRDSFPEVVLGEGESMRLPRPAWIAKRTTA